MQRRGVRRHVAAVIAVTRDRTPKSLRDAARDAIFSFALGVLGDPELTVDGLSANYTTTKRFINEAAGETGAAATQVLNGSEQLTTEANHLRSAVNEFLEKIRAA